MKNFLQVLMFASVSILQVKGSTFSIVDFGARPGPGYINTAAIQATIDSCSKTGGGSVIVPAGIYITGTFELHSNINLYLEAGAVLKGSSNLNEYRSYIAENDGQTYHYGIIYTRKAENVSITGYGIIDGNEEAFFLWDTPKKIEWGGVQYTRQKELFRKVRSGIGDGPVMPKDRPRQMIIFSECKNVLVRDITLKGSPFWTLHFADCDGVIVNGLKIWNSLETPNSDGIDVTSCSNVNISDCDIRTGDDAIAITGYAHHFELPGYANLLHISENINITNCHLQSRSSGIRIGFLDQNTVRNINISNVNITGSNRGIGIFLRDEGSLENIIISQVHIETRLHTGDWWGNGEPVHISAVRGKDNGKLGTIRNVVFRDVFCRGESGILVYGSEESIPENIRFENLYFVLSEGPMTATAGGNIDLRGCLGEKQLFSSDVPAFCARYVKNLQLSDVTIIWQNITQSWFTRALQIEHYHDLVLKNIRANPSPANLGLKPVFLLQGKGLQHNLAANMLEERK